MPDYLEAGGARIYFGFTEGLPPGVPGGGTTGIVSPDGGGLFFILGSTLAGGVMTPPERLSWELVDPLAGGTAGALGCFAPCSSAVAPTLAKASNAAARNNMLRIAASTLVLL